MKEFRVFIAGYGTVGRALHQMVHERGDAIAEQTGVRLRVVAVARSKGVWINDAGLAAGPLALDDRVETDVLGALDQVEADALAEVTPTDLKTGGMGLAHVRKALQRGVHVATANKGPVVLAHRELRDLAREHHVGFRYEATAGAAIPLMSLRDVALRGDRVTRLDGILNGTCNYILTRMGEEGLDFEQALHEAQALGYAEADPTADVGGHDAAAKCVILGNHFFDAGLALSDVAVRGITAVTGEAVQLAMKQGYVVRLVATVVRDGPAEVAPRLVPVHSPLNVPGTLNTVRLQTENAGPISITGRGAGGRETAAAVLADLLALAS